MKPSEMSDEELVICILQELFGLEEGPEKDWNKYRGRIKLTRKGEEKLKFGDAPYFELHSPDHWWMVVREMIKLGYRFSMWLERDNFGIQFYKDRLPNDDDIWHSAFSTTEGRAVLEAALAAAKKYQAHQIGGGT